MSLNGIFISSLASEPMTALESANLIENQGIEGDRYCNNQGTYSCLRASKKKPGEREPGRQLTILSKESILKAFQRNNLVAPQSLGDLRRNLVVDGISAQELLDAIGRIIEIGSDGVKVFVQRHCVPCMYNERKNKIPGMMNAIWEEAGVSCQIVQGGKISTGDKVVTPPLGSAKEINNEMLDPGIQNPGYYTPPSKRTTKMVLGSSKRMKEIKDGLMQSDPEGLQRFKDSYASVGLKV